MRTLLRTTTTAFGGIALGLALTAAPALAQGSGSGSGSGSGTTEDSTTTTEAIVDTTTTAVSSSELARTGSNESIVLVGAGTALAGALGARVLLRKRKG